MPILIWYSAIHIILAAMQPCKILSENFCMAPIFSIHGNEWVGQHTVTVHQILNQKAVSFHWNLYFVSVYICVWINPSDKRDLYKFVSKGESIHIIYIGIHWTLNLVYGWIVKLELIFLIITFVWFYKADRDAVLF